MSFLGVQISVSRTQGQSIGFPNDWLNNELNIEIQVVNHTAQYDRLLRILLPEHCAMRPNDIKQLEDYRCYTSEVPRPRNAAKSGTEGLYVHKGAEALGVDF